MNDPRCEHGISLSVLCYECIAEVRAMPEAEKKDDKPNAVLSCMTAGERLREVERLIRHADPALTAEELRMLLKTTGELIGKIAAVFEASAREGAREN